METDVEIDLNIAGKQRCRIIKPLLNKETASPDGDVVLQQQRTSPCVTTHKHKLQAALHFLILSMQLPRLYAAKRTALTMCPSGPCYCCEQAQHMVVFLYALIIFTSLTLLHLALCFLSQFPFFPWHLLIFHSFPSLSLSLSLLSSLSPPKRCSFSITSPLILLFLLWYNPSFLLSSLSHLSVSNTCIMHGEGKAARRPACANSSQRKQHSGRMKKKKSPPQEGSPPKWSP